MENLLLTVDIEEINYKTDIKLSQFVNGRNVNAHDVYLHILDIIADKIKDQIYKYISFNEKTDKDGLYLCGRNRGFMCHTKLYDDRKVIAGCHMRINNIYSYVRRYIAKKNPHGADVIGYDHTLKIYKSDFNEYFIEMFESTLFDYLREKSMCKMAKKEKAKDEQAEKEKILNRKIDELSEQIETMQKAINKILNGEKHND
jgi:hypothetical protein